MIRIVLAEDHAVVRAGVRGLLEKVDGFDVVAETESGAEVEDLVSDHSADVLVIDLALRGLDGIEGIRRARRARPSLRVVVLSMHRSDAHIAQAMQVGANAYVLKDDSFEDLVEAVRAVLRGERYLSRNVPSVERGGAVEDRYASLTPREREVLHLVAEGLTSDEIAERLVLSVRTIETHRANIMAKLGIRNQTRLVHFAMQRGLVPPPRD
ncbi:MAG: response regulator transcription factor [Rhodothermales bacterium]|nr:response regulator transcription factor [Rhodothermales bacterium]MBO6781108.1 response regulator transcription factor [Rhodothermales bacterium]